MEKKMRRVTFCLVFSALLLCSGTAGAIELESVDAAKPQIGPDLTGPIVLAGTPIGKKRLFSPSIARELHDIAYELGRSKTAGPAKIEQAIVLLKAAQDLDAGADYILPTLIELTCRSTQGERSDVILALLDQYIDESANLEVAEKAIECLLDRTNSREDREKLLKRLGLAIANKNIILGSDLIARLGMLAAEKPDEKLAGYYLTQAYKNNKFNTTAFTKLAELFPDKLGPEYYLEHLRLALQENPADIDSALKLGQYAERLELYETAADTYQYCADLFYYLYPSDPLPATIYIPWAISSYNTEKDQPKCLQIANLVRQSGSFDLMIETLAAKAAAKLGDAEQATQIFQAAEEKTLQILAKGPAANRPDSPEAFDAPPQQVTAKQFAWFYCFALPNPEKALDWANKARATEPNSPSAASILAYALVMNDQAEWAKPLIDSKKFDQISQLTMAKIQIAEDKKDLAKETLKAAIAKDPGSVAAEYAKDLLAKHGGEYIPPIQPDVVLNMLEAAFGEEFIPAFKPPDQIVSVQFNIRGNKFYYGAEFGAVIAVINKSNEQLVISENGLFSGGIRIDAQISGDLNVKIPELISTKVRTDFFVAPEESILIPVKLVSGKLRRILLTYPQASLDIEFTLYIDPVVTPEGAVTNKIARMKPTKLLVSRPGIELTSKYLRNRFNLISQGHQGQKIRTAQLFIGLLMEQYAMSGRKPPYKFVYADWMPTMFRNALVHESGLLRNPENGEWVVKVHTMAEMIYLPMDHELVAAVSENLNNSNWPVRLMSVYLLAKTQKGRFDNVLKWAARYDTNEFVREMATYLTTPNLATIQPKNPPTLQNDKLSPDNPNEPSANELMELLPVEKE